MLPIPEWAPNAHPLIVHFPLALLVAAAAADVAALAFRARWPWLRLAATGLYAAGATTALAAFLTGREAASSVLLPAGADALLTAHADWAERALWFYGLYAVARLARDWRLTGPKLPVDTLLTGLGVIGLILVVETGEDGARLVYEQGVGVAAVEVAGGMRHDHEVGHGADGDESVQGRSDGHGLRGEEHQGPEPDGDHETGHIEGHGSDHDSDHHGNHDGEIAVASAAPPGEDGSHAHGDEGAAGGLKLQEDGGWRWEITTAAPAELVTEFDWLAGHAGDATAHLVEDPERGDVLALEVGGGPILIAPRTAMGDAQVEAELRLGDFRGTVRLVHHLGPGLDCSFLALSAGAASLGSTGDGVQDVLERAEMDLSGWHQVRAVGDGRHYRGYVDGRMVLHGHGAQREPGRSGLLIEGAGRILLAGLQARPL